MHSLVRRQRRKRRLDTMSRPGGAGQAARVTDADVRRGGCTKKRAAGWKTTLTMVYHARRNAEPHTTASQEDHAQHGRSENHVNFAHSVRHLCVLLTDWVVPRIRAPASAAAAAAGQTRPKVGWPTLLGLATRWRRPRGRQRTAPGAVAPPADAVRPAGTMRPTARRRDSSGACACA